MAKTTPGERAKKKDDKLLEVVAAAAWPGDWTAYEDDMAGLSSVGAERLLKHFDIEFTKWLWDRNAWKDAEGDAFAWTYRAYVKYGKSQIMAEGRYGTRDPFWRDPENADPEKDEADVRAGARHLCLADGIKSILGLRKVPVSKLLAAGMDPTKLTRAKKEDNRGKRTTLKPTAGIPHRNQREGTGAQSQETAAGDKGRRQG